jgi:hypothetical protein
LLGVSVVVSACQKHFDGLAQIEDLLSERGTNKPERSMNQTPLSSNSNAANRYLAFLSLLALVAFCMVPALASSTNDLAHREWKVDGLTREALVYAPPKAKTDPTPVVFAFHGHGGSMQRAANMFGYHTLWPEAIVVYMQGVNTPGRLTVPTAKRPAGNSASATITIGI